MLRRLAADTRGVTSLEYGLVATLVLIAILTALNNYGTSLTTMFAYVSTKIGSVLSRGA